MVYGDALRPMALCQKSIGCLFYKDCSCCLMDWHTMGMGGKNAALSSCGLFRYATCSGQSLLVLLLQLPRAAERDSSQTDGCCMVLFRIIFPTSRRSPMYQHDQSFG
jgi:hypothetical protein